MEIATPPAAASLAPRSAARAMAPPSRFGDKAFEWLTLAMAMAVVLLVILIGWQLWRGSSLAVQKFGFHFSPPRPGTRSRSNLARCHLFTERWFLPLLRCSSLCR